MSSLRTSPPFSSFAQFCDPSSHIMKLVSFPFFPPSFISRPTCRTGSCPTGQPAIQAARKEHFLIFSPAKLRKEGTNVAEGFHPLPSFPPLARSFSSSYPRRRRLLRPLARSSQAMHINDVPSRSSDRPTASGAAALTRTLGRILQENERASEEGESKEELEPAMQARRGIPLRRTARSVGVGNSNIRTLRKVGCQDLQTRV